MWLIISIISALMFIYYVLIRPYRYWTDRGVKQGTPIPILGNNWRMILRLNNVVDELKRLYFSTCTTDRYFGFYLFFTPALVLRDPKLIKAITVKDFDHFMDHRSFLDEGVQPLFDKNLLSLKGERWRTMRSLLSPTFTGNKMRQMFVLLVELCEQFVNHFLNKDEPVTTLEMKSIFTKFCNDAIASIAFGLEVDSFENPNNDFYKMGQRLTDFSNFSTMIRFMGHMAFPRLFAFLNIKLFPQDIIDFFTQITVDNMEYRRKNFVTRPDMITLLLEAQKNGDSQESVETAGENRPRITDDDIVAQAVSFFFAGFDSVSSLMSFTAYELAANPDVQEKLFQEIDRVSENITELTYDDLSKLKYLDMVISETLRKWPSTIATDRVCTKRYTIEPERPGEKPLTIEKGSLISLTTVAYHHDPQYFPDPDRFDPERFNEENKPKIDPYTYLPFGVGPRLCIGSRLAIMETKAIIYHLVKDFEFVPVKKTVIPLKLDPKAINLAVQGGTWLGLKRRRN